MNIKKKIVIIMLCILSVTAILYFYYYFNKVKPYNDALENGNKAVALEEYDKGITFYTNALKYKNDSNLRKKIEFAKFLKKSKENYDSAIKQMSDKNYLKAIDIFNEVSEQDEKKYSLAQSKIIECKKLYITDNLNGARASFKNNKFDEANKYVGNILKIDANNSDAKELKENISKAIQKQKEEEEKLKDALSDEQIKDLLYDASNIRVILSEYDKIAFPNFPQLNYKGIPYCILKPEYNSYKKFFDFINQAWTIKCTKAIIDFCQPVEVQGNYCLPCGQYAINDSYEKEGSKIVKKEQHVNTINIVVARHPQYNPASVEYLNVQLKYENGRWLVDSDDFY